VKKTQKTPSSVMTSINDMRTRQLKYIWRRQNSLPPAPKRYVWHL
jgi:hypothetical protein